MSKKYPDLPDYLDKAIANTSIDLIDVLHGYLKDEIYNLQGLEVPDRYLQGYMTSLENIYGVCYSLMFARMDVLNGK